MKMTIGKKLFIGFGVVIALTLATGGLAIYNVDSLGESVQELGSHSARMLYLSGDINNLTSDMLATTKGILNDGFLKDSVALRADQAHYATDLFKAKSELGEMLEGARNPRVRESLGKLAALLEPFNQANNGFAAYITKSDISGAQSFYKEKLLPLANSVSDTADEVAQRENESVVGRAKKDIEVVAPARYLSILMICLSIGVGVGVVFVVRGINDTLRNNISELRDGAEQVTQAATQVSSSSQSLAQGASEQAASLEETSASSEEINSMARRNTDNSRSTAQLLTASREKVTLANRHLEEMEISMAAISESSGKISKIIKVIDEIAFQTNILALNAAVEAARAGEAGMGFSVVADEVRSLAQRSAQAAKDTTSLIEESIAKSAEGREKVAQVASAIRTITEDSEKVKVMVDEVYLGSEEQSKGIDQIRKSIAHMEQVTQTTAANAEESAAAAEQLNAQAHTMRDVVDRLQAMVDASTGPTSNHSTSVRPHSPMRIPAIAEPPVPKPSQRFSHPAFRPSAPQDEFPMEESFQSF